MITIPTTQVKTEIPPATGRTRHLLTPLPEPGHFLFVIDNSAAEKFVCPTLAANYLVEAREPHPTNAALIFGGALHVGIEELLRGEPLDKAQARLSKFFTDHPAPLDEYRILNNALEVLRYYQQRMTFPDYHMEILADAKGPLIERAFELPLGVLEVGAFIDLSQFHNYDPQVLALPEEFKVNEYGHVWVSRVHVAWAGRIDVIVRVRDRAYIMDHKTTSQAGGKLRQNFVDDFHLSSQTRGYVWAAQQLWPDLNVKAFCLDAIQFKKPAIGCALMEKGPRGGEASLDFFREYFNYSQASVEWWATNALTRVEDFIHSLVRNYFPQETTYCFNRKYGKCHYWDTCLIAQDSPEAAKKLLYSHAFRPVTWNPTADR
jgi:hypothetical protein